MADENRSTACWKTIGIAGDSSCPKLADIVHCRNCPAYAQVGRTLFDRPIPDGYREEWTKLLSIPKETEIAGAESVVIFRLRSEWLALKTRCFQETTGIRPVHTVPFRTNRVLQGLVNINGELLLCISVADMLGIAGEEEKQPAGSTAYKRMAVVKGGTRFAFSVDEVLGIFLVPLHDLPKPPSNISKSPIALVKGVLTLRDLTVGLLDEEKFFQSLERSVST